jgi:CTP:molybdopterin cytidylyltransferase MocA
MKVIPKASVIILSAGNSSRFGSDKAFLEFKPGCTFLENIVRTYIESEHISKIVVVVRPDMVPSVEGILLNKWDRNNVIVVENPHSETGRFGSIRTGLRYCSPEDFCFVQNIDNPFTSADLIHDMMNITPADGFVVPGYGNKDGHPVLLSPTLIEHLITLKGNDPVLRDELLVFKKTRLEWNSKGILANINSRQDYATYF